MHHSAIDKSEITHSNKKMTTFYMVWLGQLVSLLGSSMTGFALSLWVYQQSGLVTAFAMINVFSVIPRIVLSPVAGTLADRIDRRVLMILSDSLAGMTTILTAALFYFDAIAVWQIYLAAIFIGIANTFQWPAFMASVTQLVPKEKLGRANGMLQLNRAAAEIFAPLIAGALIVSVGIYGVMIADVITFMIGILILLALKFPKLEKSGIEDSEEKANIWREAKVGFQYIFERKGLLGLVSFNAIVSFLWGMVGATIVPMILGFANPNVLGQVLMVAGLGMLSGSLVMSAWGGPQRKVYGVIGFELLSGVCFILIGLKPLVWLVGLGAFFAHMTIAVVSGSTQAIWQVKVAPEMQGRVFGAVQMLSQSLTPLAYVLAGVLADRLFVPLLVEGGSLVDVFGGLLGVGMGRGIGLMYLLMGAIKILVSLWGFANPRIRRVELELADAI